MSFYLAGAPSGVPTLLPTTTPVAPKGSDGALPAATGFDPLSTADFSTCLRLCRETQADLNTFMDSCMNLPAQLRELLAYKVDRLLALQTQLLRRLADLPRGAHELEPVRRLLGIHRGTLCGIRRMLNEIGADDLIRLLQRRQEAEVAGVRLLKQLRDTTSATDCKRLFGELLDKFEEAATLEDCEALLQVLDICLHRISAEQRREQDWQLPAGPPGRSVLQLAQPMTVSQRLNRSASREVIKRPVVEAVQGPPGPVSPPNLPADPGGLALIPRSGASVSPNEATISSAHAYLALIGQSTASSTYRPAPGGAQERHAKAAPEATAPEATGKKRRGAGRPPGKKATQAAAPQPTVMSVASTSAQWENPTSAWMPLLPQASPFCLDDFLNSPGRQASDLQTFDPLLAEQPGLPIKNDSDSNGVTL